jgi:hypothetical protein
MRRIVDCRWRDARLKIRFLFQQKVNKKPPDALMARAHRRDRDRESDAGTTVTGNADLPYTMLSAKQTRHMDEPEIPIGPHERGSVG